MSHVEVERKGAVLLVAINRPEKRNALTGEMYSALAESFDRAQLEQEVRIILLYGKGDAFTAGNDLVDFMHTPWKGQETPPAVRFIRAVAKAEKPVVAAVHGVAVGVGTTILLHCDFVYAAAGTKLMMPFVNLGIVPEAGSTVLLPLAAGYQRAAELLMLGEPFSAEKGVEAGIINAVFEPDALLGRAMETAQKLADKPTEALLACKRLLRRTYAQQVDRAIAEEVSIIAERLDSPETREALLAFVEKRKPIFAPPKT